jgi:hypothetical protein
MELVLKIKTWHYSQKKSRCHARIDGVNNYLMFSDKLTQWDNPVVLQEPVFHHGIYTNWIADLRFGLRKELHHPRCRGHETVLPRCLSRFDDPSKEIGRLKDPLLSPREEEREGYVPNVVFLWLNYTTIVLYCPMQSQTSTYGVEYARVVRCLEEE